MSCERSRGKLIASLATVLNANPGELQRTYDGAAPSGSAAASEPLRGKVETVMSWFDAAGLTRPVHGDAHGLPRRAAWSGYAALHDHVMTDGRSPLVLMQRLAASRVPTATLARVDGDVLDSLFGDTDPFEAGDRGPASAVDGATGTDPVGRDREDLEIRGYTCGDDGVWRDPAGFDVLGRDRTGRDRYGYDIQGTNRLGVNNTGRYPDGRHLSGYHPDTGLDADGFDVRGYRLGDNRTWRDREGFDLEGYDAAGYDRRGYDRQARHRDGRLHPFFSRASAQGIYPDGFDADGRSPQGGSSQVAPINHLAARWSTARGTYDKRAARNGVPLHCPRCGQFVAKSSGWHACPKVGSPWLTLFEGTGGLGDRRLAQLGEPSEYPSLSAEAYNQRVDKRVYANGNVTVNDPSSESRQRLILVPGGNTHPLSEVCLPAGPHLPKEHLYTAAASPAYFPTVPGSAEAGYVLCTNSDQTERPVIRLDAFGFDPQGYDTQGYDADGFNRQGLDREGQPRPGPADAARPKGYELNFEDATRARRILEGVAASFLGYDCAVELAPGSGQNFASLLESPPRIRIDNLPLGVRAHPDDNLVCARGLLDHELGHWHFTRPDVFGAAVRISQRELKVSGLDRMAPEVKSLNNLIEDGRMERLVAGLGVGFGQDLAALARMFPVWGETVGDMQVYADIRRARDPDFTLPAPDTEEYQSLERNWLYHQVSGALLVEALPFTQLRPEVVAGMHPRARQAVEDLIPMVRMGVSGNCQQGLRATIEVARYLEQAGIYPDEQADPTLPEGSVTVRDPGGWTKEFEAAGAGAKDNSPELSDRDILIEFERPVHIKIKGKPDGGASGGPRVRTRGKVTVEYLDGAPPGQGGGGAGDDNPDLEIRGPQSAESPKQEDSSSKGSGSSQGLESKPDPKPGSSAGVGSSQDPDSSATGDKDKAGSNGQSGGQPSDDGSDAQSKGDAGSSASASQKESPGSSQDSSSSGSTPAPAQDANEQPQSPPTGKGASDAGSPAKPDGDPQAGESGEAGQDAQASTVEVPADDAAFQPATDQDLEQARDRVRGAEDPGNKLQMALGARQNKPLNTQEETRMESYIDLAGALSQTSVDTRGLTREQLDHLERGLGTSMAQLRKECRDAGRKLAERRLRRLMDDADVDEGRHYTGQLDTSELPRAEMGRRDVFERSMPKRATGFAVSVVVDVSGSMHGSMGKGHLLRSVLTLTEAFDHLSRQGFNIPYEVRLFADSKDRGLIKTMGDRTFSDERAGRLAFTPLAGSGTSDLHTGVVLAAQALGSRPERHKLLCVLTDGDCSDQAEAQSALERARKGVGRDRRSQVGVFGLFYGVSPSQQFRELFGKNGMAIQSLAEIPEKIGATILRIFGQGGRR